MAQRLVKIAKELNVGTSTIVDHLVQRGFEIDNKPTAKVSDEMYEELLKEFSGSLSIKEKADQLVIGNRISHKEAATPPPPPPPIKKAPPAPVKKETPPPPPPPPVVEEKVEPAKEESPQLGGLKVMGKINLDETKKKTVKEEKKAEVKKAPPVETPPAPPVAKVEPPVKKETEAKPPAKEEKKPEAKKEEDKPKETKPETPESNLIRAKTPQLKGLKILGKIDASKLESNKKKKDTPGPANDDPNKRKRKRKRKKVSVAPNQGGGQRRQGPGSGSGGNRGGSSSGGRRSPRDENKEVSKKEIEEKIKQTMARLSGGGKKKRQKLRRDHRDRHREKAEMIEAEKETGKLQLTEFISVSELAGLMDISVTDVITTCMNLGVIVSINQRLDAEIIELVADEFNHEVEFISAEDEVEDEDEIVDDPKDLKPRSPIVTVMGHVDHGKTSLLDFIRSESVASGEAGGITQHIGAYEVAVGEDKKKITFLDTPGHEAFTAMRARGAKVTDVAVIIVAADDSIMPQTKEAISHAQAAGVPMVFAINKIDKDNANPDRIKQELSTMNILIEEWGGKYQSQDISAKNGTNIDMLLEKILLEAEILELQANPDREAVGTVIEASLDKGRGFVTKILVQNGTLEIGNSVVAGEFAGKVKAMFNEHGKKVKKAGPSAPVLVLGLSGAPQAGEKFRVMESDQEARQIASRRAQISREQSNRANKRISLDEIGRRLALGNFKELNLIVKGDVDGSIEALADALIKQSIETVQVNVIHKAVGQIIESDVLLASASDAIIIGFQVRPSLLARKLAEREGVEIKTYSIIYEAIDEVRSAIEGMLEPTKEEKIVGQVEVREVYKISRVGTVAGCFVQEGVVSRNHKMRIIRDGIVIFPTKEGVTGELSSLKRFKDDVKEVKSGFECGCTVKNYNDLKVGDIIETYIIEEVKQTLDKQR